MRRLVIETATRACSVALFEGDACIASIHEEIGRGHAERLIPMIAELPDKGFADAIHVDVGPGSFTGIRVGVSAARALAYAWGAECFGYGCLDLVAAMAVETNPPLEAFAVAMIGGHGEYFVQYFDADGYYNGMQPPVSLPAEQALRQLKRFRFIAGDAAETLIASMGTGKAIPLLPDAKYWSADRDLPTLPPTARYIRGADAKLPVAGRT